MTTIPKIKLTYFDIEGRAEPVRLALVLTKVPFEDERIGFADWQAMKPSTPYGQLPVMTVDNGPMQAQSKAMVRWIGRSFSQSLYPADKLLEIEEMIGLIEDLERDFMPCMYIGMRPEKFGYPANYQNTDEGKKLVQTMRESFVKNELPRYMQYFTNIMDRQGGPWLVSGDSPTIADCLAVPLLRGFTRGNLDYVPTNCLDEYPKVVDYVKRFCALEGVKGRYNSGIF